MPPTVEEIQDLALIQKELKAAGISLAIVDNPQPKAQWYRADGMPMPKLLPADPHHRRVYKAKGWSLIPPAEVATVVAAETFADPVPVQQTVPEHSHRFKGHRLGSSCNYKGCPVVRIAPYRPHAL